MTHVETSRKFNSYAEDPAAASKAFQLRRNYWRADDQVGNSNYLLSKFQVAWSALDAVVDGDGESNPDLSGIKSALAGLNDPSSSGRFALGTDLVAKSESIVLAMNAKYGQEFVFAGADGLNVPFAWDGDTLRYRNVDVDSAAAGKMVDEATYVDIGLGMEEDASGNIIPSSAYNSALSGVDVLGWGTDADGDPKNLASLMRELGELFMDCDSDTGEFADPGDRAIAERLTQKLFDAMDRVSAKHVELTSKSSYLQTNLAQLNVTKDTLNEEIEDIEMEDPASLITEMLWAQYTYNASLQIGNDILSQSLLDYMR